MVSEDSSAVFDLAIQLLIPVAIVAFAFWRGARARAQGADGRIAAWTKRAYWCFLVWGAFLILCVPVLYRIERLPSDRQEGGAALFGFLAGVPAGIVLLVGVFHAVMVWRGRWIRVLLGSTTLAAALFFVEDYRTEPLLSDSWSSALGVVYALVTLVASIGGLRTRRISRDAEEPPGEPGDRPRPERP